MRPTAVARSLQGLIPPKIATPASVVSPLPVLTDIGHRICQADSWCHPVSSMTAVSSPLVSPTPRLCLRHTPSQIIYQSSGASSTRTENVISFYKSLPKGPGPKVGGLKGRYFSGENASG